MAESTTTPRHDVGVGLISVGWMGKLHSRAYQALPYVYPETGIRPRLVRAADTAPDRVEYATDVLGYAHGSTDYREVLADPDVEVVSICAPNMLHLEIGVAAAEAGKPFWIEKGRPDGRGDAAAAAAATPRAGHLHRLQTTGTPRGRDSATGRRVALGDHQRAAVSSPVCREPRSLSCLGRSCPAAGRGDLLSHVVDLMQYVVGPVAEVTALTSTVYSERPILPMGSATHFAVIEDGELGPVENEDYAATLVRFADDAQGAGAVGTLEASRTIVGPQCGLAFELYGTEGSLAWNFEQMNELRVWAAAAPTRATRPSSAIPSSATTPASSRGPGSAWATTT